MDPEKLSEWLWKAKSTHPPDLARMLCDNFVIRQREFPLSGAMIEDHAPARRKWKYDEDSCSG